MKIYEEVEVELHALVPLTGLGISFSGQYLQLKETLRATHINVTL